jgi:hypothetical protein
MSWFDGPATQLGCIMEHESPRNVACGNKCVVSASSFSVCAGTYDGSGTVGPVRVSFVGPEAPVEVLAFPQVVDFLCIRRGSEVIP